VTGRAAIWVLAGLTGPIVTGALLTTCGGDGTPARDPAASTVAIDASGCGLADSRAVGVVVGPGLVATVAHAVAGQDEITVTTPDGRRLPGQVAAIDTGMDAALLRIGHLDVPPLRTRPYADREPVELLLSDDGQVSSTPVEVRRRVEIATSDIYRQGHHVRPGFELQAEIVAGDSGGGIVGADGSLLGVVWATSRETDGRAWAITVDAYAPLLDRVRAGMPALDAPCAA
jgi:S1-C subfamily serine protease